jgi:hypothetical protein
MNVLSLDVSSKTGWALFVGDEPVDYGRLDLGTKIAGYCGLRYPKDHLAAARKTADKILQHVQKYSDTIPGLHVVIEDLNRGHKVSTQHFLDWTHCFVLEGLAAMKIPVEYLTSGVWRAAVGLRMTTEDKKHNKEIRSKPTKKAGKITKKHLAVRLCNQRWGNRFGFILKDHDIADAILLGSAYLNLCHKSAEMHVD